MARFYHRTAMKIVAAAFLRHDGFMSKIAQNALRDALTQHQANELRNQVDQGTASGNTALKIHEDLNGIWGHALSAYETLARVRTENAEHDPVAVALDLDRLGHDEAECSLALLLVADVRAELNRTWEMAGLEGSPFPTTDAS